MKRRLEYAPGCFCDAPATNVTTLHSIDDAWSRYCALVQAQRDDERLLTDRDHQEALARALWDLHVRGGLDPFSETAQ